MTIAMQGPRVKRLLCDVAAGMSEIVPLTALRDRICNLSVALFFLIPVPNNFTDNGTLKGEIITALTTAFNLSVVYHVAQIILKRYDSNTFEVILVLLTNESTYVDMFQIILIHILVL